MTMRARTDRLYVTSGATYLLTADKPAPILPKGLPTLSEVLSNLKHELEMAGVDEWNTTIEVELSVGTGTVLPGGSAGIKAKIEFKGKTNS